MFEWWTLSNCKETTSKIQLPLMSRTKTAELYSLFFYPPNQLFSKSCYSWHSWMWVTLTDGNFHIYCPLLSEASSDVFCLLTITFPWKTDQLGAGWTSLSPWWLWATGYPKVSILPCSRVGRDQLWGTSITEGCCDWCTLQASSKWSFSVLPSMCFSQRP